MRNKRFSIQIDEMTGFSRIGYVIAYVRFVEDTMNEDLLFCKPIQREQQQNNSSKLLIIS
jgi:hypothetical protein